jgi:hypothetical protein
MISRSTCNSVARDDDDRTGVAAADGADPTVLAVMEEKELAVVSESSSKSVCVTCILWLLRAHGCVEDSTIVKEPC